MARHTFSGFAGVTVIGPPMACATAFSTAAGVGISDGSPTPFAPYGPKESASSTIKGVITGASRDVGI